MFPLKAEKNDINRDIPTVLSIKPQNGRYIRLSLLLRWGLEGIPQSFEVL